MWANYHTHCDFCDGAQPVAEVVEQARAQSLLQLGFSSHAPLPFKREWCMNNSDLDAYVAEIRGLHNARLPLWVGLEVDFIPGVVGPRDFRSKTDYTIGSIHFVEQLNDGERWEVDGPRSMFLKGFQEIFKNKANDLVHRYYSLTREMMAESRPDVVGHIDKIKLHNNDCSLFREDERWYRQEVLKTLDVAKETGVIIEVNTRGWYQSKTTEQYPSDWILEEIWNLGIPITLSSDAHHAKDLTNYFHEAAIKLLRIGFKNLTILSEGIWKEVPFDEHGIRI